MKTNRKTTALVILLLSAAILSACGDTAAETPDNAKTDTNAAGETEAVTEEPTETDLRARIPDNLPDMDMGGYSFRVSLRSRDDFVSDCGIDLDQTGEVVDDAIYSRNHTVMDRFNCKLVANIIPDGTDFNKNIVKSITANEDAMDLALGQITTMPSLCTEGYFLDWYEDLPNVNLEQPWYIGNAAEAFSVGHHSYVMIGEYDLDVLRFTYCMYFNKDIAKEYDLGDIYQVVNDGKWTYDYLYNLATQVYRDLDGNGQKSEADQLCIAGDPHSAVVTYQYAFGSPTYSHDENGIPYLSVDTNKANDCIVKLNKLYWDTPGGYTKDWGSGSTAWNAGNLLFLTGLFGNSSSYRDLNFDFGIIPYPKYDEAQSQYYTMSDGAHGCMVVPITISDPVKTSVILEALNAETYKQVIPAYFDTALKVKYARDNESGQMLDLLMDCRVFDFGYAYGTDIPFIYDYCISTNSDKTESRYVSMSKTATKKIDKIIEAYQNIE